MNLKQIINEKIEQGHFDDNEYQEYECFILIEAERWYDES